MLIEAYRKGEIELNTYDEVGTKTGPHGFMLGEFPLEFEIAFIGNEIRDRIQPLLREALRQEHLELIPPYRKAY